MITDRQYAVAMQKSLRAAQYYGGHTLDSTKGKDNYSENLALLRSRLSANYMRDQTITCNLPTNIGLYIND